MSHAAGCAQRCAQCGEDTYQYLNHHFPCFFLHNLFVFCHTEITEIDEVASLVEEIHRNLNLCRGKSKNLSEHQCFCDFCEFLCDLKNSLLILRQKDGVHCHRLKCCHPQPQGPRCPRCHPRSHASAHCPARRCK